jgi:hypothetical protein
MCRLERQDRRHTHDTATHPQSVGVAEDGEVGVEPGQLVLIAVAVDVDAAARQQLRAVGLARLVRGRVAPEHGAADGRREALDGGGGVGVGGRGQQRTRDRERRREEETHARGQRHGDRCGEKLS